jgi:hypothetical protein
MSEFGVRAGAEQFRYALHPIGRNCGAQPRHPIFILQVEITGVETVPKHR